MKKISVIVPCLNEENTIALLLKAILDQSYPTTHLKIWIADGMSTDKTRLEIENFQRKNKELAIKILDNPSRSIPVGLNLAIAKSDGEIILRLDAHSVPSKNYIENCVKDLEAGKGWNVGGLWNIQAGVNTWIAESIALAAAHPFAIGDAKYRYSSKAQAVDTIPFGSFKRELIDQIGNFDESLQANEDYEFNARIRAAGGIVWFNPAIHSIYFARPSFIALANQYARYGYWKWRMLLNFPDTIKWRQALPPAFVFGLIMAPIFSIWLPWLAIPWGAAVVLYILLLLALGIQKSLQNSKLTILLGLPTAILIMHLSYGSAMIWSMAHSLFNRN